MSLGLLGLVLTSCGGAGGGAAGGVASGGGSGGSSPAAGGGSCATSAAAKVMGENPRAESPGIAFSASLAALGTAVTVTNLDGSCLLKNSTLGVVSDREFPTTIANVSQGLIFSPSDPRFQQITSYFYANRVKNVVTSSGGDISTLTGLTIDAHCTGYMSGGSDAARDNAFFLPSSKLVCLGYTYSGAKKLYASDDADVISHEFGHAINHTLASTSIMNSSLESGALDESVADYWALTVNNNASLSEWFLGAIDAADVANPDPFYQRVATQNNLYPQSLIGEIHFDARPFTESLWSIRQALGATKADTLVTRMMDLLPATTRYKDAVSALRSAAIASGLSAGERTSIDTILTNKGLLRTDAAADIAISNNAGRSSIYIIDDHTYSYQVGGNCNGTLDVGETALVMVNLESAGSALGLLVGTGSTSSAGVSFPAGGTVAEYMRLNGGGADFVDVIRTSGVQYDDVTAYASLLISASTSGVKNFNLAITTMSGATVNVPFSLTVGSTATRATTCASGSIANRSLWPKP